MLKQGSITSSLQFAPLISRLRGILDLSLGSYGTPPMKHLVKRMKQEASLVAWYHFIADRCISDAQQVVERLADDSSHRSLIDHEPAELTELKLEVSLGRLDAKPPCDLRLAEVVAMWNCCLVCSCMALTESLRRFIVRGLMVLLTECTQTWLEQDCRDRTEKRSFAERCPRPRRP